MSGHAMLYELNTSVQWVEKDGVPSEFYEAVVELKQTYGGSNAIGRGTSRHRGRAISYALTEAAVFFDRVLVDEPLQGRAEQCTYHSDGKHRRTNFLGVSVLSGGPGKCVCELPGFWKERRT